MAIWPFNRKKSEDALPEEVKEYYESGRKQRTGTAWLLALGTLLVTILVAFGLFFGGRWVYQQIAGDDEPAEQTTQELEEAENREASNNQPAAPDDTSDDSDSDSPSSVN